MTDKLPREIAAPGWYVEIEGHDFDILDWEVALRPPFDPTVVRLSDGIVALRSEDFQTLEEASEVRERARVIVARLNGAMAIHASSQPLTLGRVMEIGSDGERKIYALFEGHASGRSRATAVGAAIGADGKAIPPLPLSRSKPQLWVGHSRSDDDLADLLDHFGRANNWYDIYKSIELAERLAGGESRLREMLGDQASRFKNMRTTANFFRHARAHRPDRLATLNEARELLADGVRAVIAKFGDNRDL